SSGAFAATMPVADGFQKGDSIQVTVVSQEQADQLFAEFAGREDLAFNIVEGCVPKAAAMVRIADAQKIEMGKVWAHGSLMRGITYRGETGEYKFHVAPVLFVKNKNEKPKLMVFDPLLFKKPVAIDIWLEKLKSGNGSISEVYYSSRFQFGHRYAEEKKYSWHSEDKEKEEQMFGEIHRNQDMYEMQSLEDKHQTPVVKKGTK
ncbi:MAG: protein-glutamine glutaminase family protein, partial [Bdellovibrio sp.]